MKNYKKIYYAEANFDDDEINASIKVLKNQKYSLMGGKQTKYLEKKVANLFRMKFGLMTNSGSSSNLLAVKAFKFEENSEVITPALTFSTTVAPIVQSKLIPVFIDVDYNTLQIDINKIEKAISKKTVAIMAPNLIGNIADWKNLRKLANRYKIKLIEDSADTIGYKYLGKTKYKKAEACTTSFYASHVVTGAGFGGMACFNDEKILSHARILRSWGRRSANYNESEDYNTRFECKISGIDYDDKYVFDELGYNFIGSDISAAFAISKIKKLNKNINKRIENFEKLKKIFIKHSDNVHTFDTTKNYKTGWLAFPFLLKNKYKDRRKDLQIQLEKSGIQTRTIFTGNITKQPVAKKFKWRSSGNLNVADNIMKSGILIGCHELINDKDIAFIKKQIDDFLK